tara:strand:+ start:142 stop:402 length:261 start_codon:yes stop_codon:yes gene_type:complete
MLENFNTQVLNEIVSIVGKTSDTISGMFQGTAPFDKKPLSMDEQILKYKTLDQPKLQGMIQEFGEDEVEKWMGKIEQSIQRRGLNG